MTDIYNREKYLSQTVEKIKESEFSDHNTELILEFRSHLMAENLSTDRICRYMTSFNTLAQHIDFKLDEVEKKELKDLVGKINQNRIDGKATGKLEHYDIWVEMPDPYLFYFGSKEGKEHLRFGSVSLRKLKLDEKSKFGEFLRKKFSRLKPLTDAY